MFSATGSWDAANQETLLAGMGWDDPTSSTSDPVGDLQARMIASAQKVTDIWFNEQVAFAFLRHPSVRDHMRQMLGDSAPSPQVAAAQGDFAIPGFPPFHVVGAKVLNETTDALDYVLGDTVVLTSNPPGEPSRDRISTAKRFRRRGDSGTGWTSREYFVNSRGLRGGTMLVAGHAEVELMTSDIVGGIVLNVLQA